MTTEDKLWIGGGVALALGGGIYYFVQKGKQNKEVAPTANYLDEPKNDVIPKPKPKRQSLATASIQSQASEVETTPIRGADTFRYSIGQEVMAIGFNGTKTYDARKMADGNYISEGIRKATFKKGDKIGSIIWVGVKPDGSYRYVVERNGRLLNDIYWIADQSMIKPVGKILPTVTTTSITGIDKNKLLAKGSKGAEVRTLQTLLKIKVDGDFGSNTEKALFAKQKVKQIRLKNWKL